MTSDILKRAAEVPKHDHIGPGQAFHCQTCNPEGHALMPELDDKPGIWPDFIAPAQYIDPHPRWEDPRLPDFRLIWRVARECGYSIGLHGSMKRDCDLIAAPWTEEAVSAEDLIQRLCASLDASPVGAQNPEPAQKPHGRLAWCLQINGWFKIIDISVMPRPDMAAAIAERDNRMESLEQGMVDLAISLNKIAEHQVSELLSEIERLTARAEAADAETLEQARLLGMGAERELALMAKADRWERMADRLAEAVIGAQQIVLHCEITDGSCCCGEEMVRHSNPINCGHQPIDHGQYQADKWLEGSVDLIAAHAAMKEGR